MIRRRASINSFLFLIISAIVLMISMVNAEEGINKNNRVQSLTIQGYLEQTSPNWELMKDNTEVRGIYMTGYTIADNKKFEKLVKLIDETELNAVVIDVKSDEGMVLYQTNLKDVQFSGANSKIVIEDIDAVLRYLNEKEIYTIARIVTFKDNKAASKFPHLAVKTTSGTVWRDRNNQAWLNPYNQDAWNYVLDIAEEAAVKGFKEIQFDYVRFPTDGNIRLIDYGALKNKNKAQAIGDFLKYARERLSNIGAVTSADVFGLVTTAENDMNIGQQLEYLADSVDVICPMVYPSHYGKGSYGVAEPDFEPYKIVNYSMKKAKERLSKDEKSIARLRPWLQDFSATYLPRYKKYGPAEIRAQIKATNDAGVKEWILWNAANRYTVDGLNKE
ncbi:MAG: putative glycoside hydrolase [Lutisporaceae bacterium]